MAEQSPYPGTPKWVKAFAVTAIVLVLLLVVLSVTGIRGKHGPGRHMPSTTNAGAEATRSQPGHTPPEGGH